LAVAQERCACRKRRLVVDFRCIGLPGLLGLVPALPRQSKPLTGNVRKLSSLPRWGAGSLPGTRWRVHRGRRKCVVSLCASLRQDGFSCGLIPAPISVDRLLYFGCMPFVAHYFGNNRAGGWLGLSWGTLPWRPAASHPAGACSRARLSRTDRTAWRGASPPAVACPHLTTPVFAPACIRTR